MKKENAARAADIAFISVCIALVLFIGICVYALPRESFSEEENRALASFPVFSLERLWDGSFFEGLSAFYSDAVPMRSTLIRAKALCELALGKSENNGVLFLSDGRLADRGIYESLDALDGNLRRIRAFSAERKTVCAFVPRAVDIYTESEYSAALSKRVYSYGLGGQELSKSFLKAARGGGEIYYKTDHHLSAEGVYILYENIMKSLGTEPYKRADFKLQTVSNAFLGSAYSSAGLISKYGDSVSLLRYDGDGDFLISCKDRGCELCSFYDFEELEGKDKYRVFTGGNHGEIHISSLGGERERLLVVKDSFANAVLPLLARHFDLIVIDPRYKNAYIPDGIYASVFIIGVDTLAKNSLDFG